METERVTRTQAAEILGLSISSVQRLVDANQLYVAEQIGGGEHRPALCLYDRAAVEALRDERAAS